VTSGPDENDVLNEDAERHQPNSRNQKRRENEAGSAGAAAQENGTIAWLSSSRIRIHSRMLRSADDIG
jgi:hypothetical protein